jgi:hypothetical protein
MPQAQDGPPLSATSPLADLPGFSLDWPRPDLQLPPLESLSQESEAVAALAALDKQEEVTPPPCRSTATPAACAVPSRPITRWNGPSRFREGGARGAFP